MDTKVHGEPTVLDTVKLVLAAAVILAGIVGYYYYADLSVLLRVVGVLIATVLGGVIALQSAQGQTLWKFIQGSRVELAKIVWPTREEALQTTMAVLIFAVLLGVFFWLLDLFLLWVTRLLTGQGG